MPAEIVIDNKNTIEFRDLIIGETFFAEGCDDIYIKLSKDTHCNTWNFTDGNYTTILHDTTVRVITKISIDGTSIISDLSTYEKHLEEQ